MTLRCLEELKKHGIKQPTGIKIDQNAGTGLREEKELNADVASVTGDKELTMEGGNFNPGEEEEKASA